MNPNIRQLLQLTISLILHGLLSGCILYPEYKYPEPGHTGKNHYEPVILTSDKDMVSIKYLTVGSNAEHEQVKQLISDHCDGAYIETSRVELRGYTTVDAECNWPKAVIR